MAIWIAQIDTNDVSFPPCASVAPGVEPIIAAVALGWNEPGAIRTIIVPGEPIIDPDTGQQMLDPDTGEPMFEPDHEEQVQDPPVYNGKWREITDDERIELQKPLPNEAMRLEYTAKREAIRRKYESPMDGAQEGSLFALSSAFTAAQIKGRDQTAIDSIKQQYADAEAAMQSEYAALDAEYGVVSNDPE